MKKILLFLITAFSCLSTQAINIKLLKGTHTIVPPEYSPVMGLSFLEWNIAEQWYKLSPKIQNEQIAEVLKNHPEALTEHPELKTLSTDLGKNSATENLIMSMFHIAGGTFNITNADDNPVKSLKPHHIGQILRLVQKWTQASANPEQLESLKKTAAAQQEKHSDTINQLKEKTKNLVSARAKAKGQDTIDAAKKAIDENNTLIVQHEKLLKNLPKPESKSFINDSLQHELFNLCIGFQFKNKNNELFTEKYWKAFVSSLVGSIQESTGEGQTYANNTPQGILLGFLLKISNTKNDLLNYFKAFTGNDTLSLKTTDVYSKEEIAEILAAQTDATDFEKFADLLSAYTYKEKYDAAFPKITSNTGVSYKSIYFQDCMDTTIRMLTNIVTYSPSKGEVGVVPDALTMNENIQQFYRSENGLCKLSAEVGNNKVHQAWAQVIEDLPGCIYKNIGDGHNSTISKHDGAIPVELAPKGLPAEQLIIGQKTYQLPVQKVGERTYLLVPKELNLVCAEMKSNISNVLTTMNYIFNLQLFDNQTAIFDPSFASTYFKQMCEKLGWEPEIDIALLDEKKSLEIPITNNAGVFILHSLIGHAYITTKDESTLDINLEVPLTTNPAMVAAIVGANLELVPRLPEKLQAPFLYENVSCLNNDDRYDNLNSQLTGSAESIEIHKDYIKSLIMSFCFVEDDVFLANLIAKGPQFKTAGLDNFFIGALLLHDVQYKKNIILRFYSGLIKSQLITIEKGLYLKEQALHLFEKEIKGSNTNAQLYIPETIKSLIKNNLITTDQALPLIEMGIKNSNPEVRESALSGVEFLRTKNLITTGQALPFIKKGINDSDPYVQAEALYVISVLAHHQLMSTDQALPFIKKGINKSDEYCRYHTFVIINALAENQSISGDQALHFIQNGINDSSLIVQDQTPGLPHLKSD